MNIFLKRTLLFISAAVFLVSCAKGPINVPEQDVSFISPPSDWKITLFTSTSKVPTGGFLPIKFFKASWSKDNLSTIGITGANISGIKKAGATRAGLLNALQGEVNEFKKVCGYVNYHITNEANGTLRAGIDFTSMEADIYCYFTDPDDPLKARTVLYVVESSDYLYTLQFKAEENFYDKDIPVFEKVLDSITFAGR